MLNAHKDLIHESFVAAIDRPDDRAMANCTIYTQAYSESSAGQLVSAKGPKGGPLSYTALLEEFRNHADKWSREPTALVSASDRIVDTLKRAFDKHYENGESPADIWIAFIGVPLSIRKTAIRVHSAKKLAEKCNLSESSNLFLHEVVFEWAIPEKYVLHEVSLQTLIERGLQEHNFVQPSTQEVRCCISRQLLQLHPWEIGVTLGSFARKFGARAPLNWVSHQLFRDCVSANIISDDRPRLYYAHGHTETVDLKFISDLDDGIDTSLCDWWLSHDDFFQDYEKFKDLVKDRLLYGEEENESLAAIEAEAVEIGL